MKEIITLEEWQKCIDDELEIVLNYEKNKNKATNPIMEHRRKEIDFLINLSNDSKPNYLQYMMKGYEIGIFKMFDSKKKSDSSRFVMKLLRKHMEFNYNLPRF